jgi:hypothetical protein
MTEYKNYTPFSFAAVVFFKLFQCLAPAGLLLMGLFQVDWHDGWQTAWYVAISCFFGAVTFVGFYFLGMRPLALRISPDGLMIREWRKFVSYGWDELRAVRHYRWTGGVDLILRRRRLTSRHLVRLMLSRQSARGLVEEVRRYTPEVKVIARHF